MTKIIIGIIHTLKLKLTGKITSMNSCVFCKIVKSGSYKFKVYEDEHTFAFFPDEPIVPGHTLVIPKDHVVDLLVIDEKIAHYVMNSVLKVGNAIRSSLKPDGLNLVQSSGKAAGQKVFHIHFHLVPRWNDDAIGELWPSTPEPTVDQTHIAFDALKSVLDSIKNA